MSALLLVRGRFAHEIARCSFYLLNVPKTFVFREKVIWKPILSTAFKLIDFLLNNQIAYLEFGQIYFLLQFVQPP